MKDHLHTLFGLPVTGRVSDIVGFVKANSSRWVNEKKFVSRKFEWQQGYGAFSYSRNQRDAVINYIRNQEAHHAGKTFREEYLELLHVFQVSYQEPYLFDFFE